ncbi:sulfotransferase [Thalassoroseus pseudoceratinae]|uniref:sulfotransferase n=1 Tax=Thalassoroseus pseudoceratinae TaxID=2713176 RepID=UPI00141DD323|nr:sulfotransferase [Thalassoroseus pseudoceratinae]
MRRFNKIHVIALPRCATVSVCDALRMLGIRLAHLGRIDPQTGDEHHDTSRLVRMHQQITQGDARLDILEECDGLADYPACIASVYQTLDRQYPGSLFINVRRDSNPQAWLSSARRQFIGLRLLKSRPNATGGDHDFVDVMNEFREMTFGSREFDGDKYLHAYHAYQQEVERYFAERPDALLDIPDISVLNGQGFDRLCDFLDCAKPSRKFPYNNRHSIAPEQAYRSALSNGTIRPSLEDADDSRLPPSHT